MKKRLSVVALLIGAAIPLLSTPALARDGDRRDRYHDGERDRHREREWREHERREREIRRERYREYHYRHEYRDPYRTEYGGNGYYDRYGVWRLY